MINASTSVYCIFGNPVRHSLSPIMHNAAFAHYSINAVYVAFEVTSIIDAVCAIKALNIKGASITVPFKVDVLPLCDHVDDLAVTIGSVNTLHNDNGTILGYNTDGYGLLMALQHAHVLYKEKKILIIGNGGSARAIAYTLAFHGAIITICGRNITNVMNLAKDLTSHFIHVNTELINELTSNKTACYDILINTTPVGMGDNREMPIDEKLIHPHHVVVDIIYSPLETLLLQKAKQKGCITITGDSMLLFQACKQFEIWTGKHAPFDIMHNALKQSLQ